LFTFIFNYKTLLRLIRLLQRPRGEPFRTNIKAYLHINTRDSEHEIVEILQSKSGYVAKV